MKKMFLLPLMFLIFAGCGSQSTQSCIDSCKEALSSVCTEDQTQTCSSICTEDEEIRNCLMSVDSCEDLEDRESICFSKPEFDKDVAAEEEGEKEPGCDSVCNKYMTCAGFGDDVTEADKQDAYDSCMVECPGWSSEGVACMDENEIKNPMDCMQLSVCGAQEYNDFL